MIPIYSPYLEPYKKSALEAIESGWISNHGIYIEKATQKLKEILNVKYTILMNNGTCATHCLFLALKFRHPEISKIYVPNNVYVAAWNSALMEYSKEKLEVLPIDEETWNMREDEEFLSTLDSNSAVLIVHNLGNIINVPRLKRLRPDLIFIEDNCEGAFGEYEGVKSGCYEGSLCSSMSFYGNKTITTGEGGAFVTNHDDVYDYISKVYSQGMSNIRYLHNVHAYNYRMTNIQAAFLYDQLCDIDNILLRKQKVFDEYDKLFNNTKLIRQKVNENIKRANWIYAVRIPDNSMSPTETFNFFREQGVETRPFFYSFEKHLHLENLKSYHKINKEISNKLTNEIVMIPSSPLITFEEQKIVTDSIINF